MGHYPISFRAMGSPCELQLYAATAGQAEVAAQRALADIELLEARYSRYRDTSLLSHINRVAAQGGALDLDEETAALLDYADTCYQRSDGLFDVSSGLLRRAWNFAAARLPDPAEIHAILPRVGWDKLIWRRPRLEFPVPDMELDLGGLVKEYAADRAAGLLLAAGIEGGLVNLGETFASWVPTRTAVPGASASAILERRTPGWRKSSCTGVPSPPAVTTNAVC